jgi:hypothetical protein
MVTGNYIGTDPTGRTAWPNLRGLRGDFGDGFIFRNVISGNTYSGMWIWAAHDELVSFTINENRIGTAADGITPLPNGAAGILSGDRVAADLFANVIANHPGMGVALVRGETYVAMHANSMRDNGGLGIDWGIDGHAPLGDDLQRTDPNPPLLHSARYDAATNRTSITITIDTHLPRVGDGVSIGVDVYANRAADGDGEMPLLPHGPVGVLGTNEIFVEGDYRGQWINATVTRLPQFFLRTPGVRSQGYTYGDDSTSELSNAVRVE